ncbi:MAG: hypothetical protein AB7V50_09235 [Vampirovibrionia bacterium]
MKKFIVINMILCALSITGCSSPKNIALPDNVTKLEEIAPKLKNLKEDDKELLTKYLMRREIGKAFGNDSFQTPITVGEAIEKQKEFEKDMAKAEYEAEMLRQQELAEYEKIKKKFDENLTVALIGKEFTPSDYRKGIYQDTISIAIAFKNKGDKDIAGVKGETYFNDIFGDNIKTLSLSLDEEIKANDTLNYLGSINYNQFMPEDTKLANTEIDKIKFTFKPSVILFKDGTKLEAHSIPGA